MYRVTSVTNKTYMMPLLSSFPAMAFGLMETLFQAVTGFSDGIGKTDADGVSVGFGVKVLQDANTMTSAENMIALLMDLIHFLS